MQDKPENKKRTNWQELLVDIFFILLIFGCIFLFACRAIWSNHDTFARVIGALIVMVIAIVIYYLLKKRDSIYRR